MTHLSLRLLGPFRGTLDGEPLDGFRSDKVRALLAYLSVEWQRPWSRETLADLLWADFPEENARSNLRNALSNLRTVIGDRRADPPFLDISRATVQFNDGSDWWVDVRAFLELVPEGDRDEGQLSDEDVDRLEEALTLYRGRFLEGIAVDSAPFEEWMVTTGQGLRQKLLRTVRRLALAHAASGDLTGSTDVTRRWLELEPWDEAGHRHMMRLLALRDQRNAALAHFRTWRQTLLEELAVEPEPTTVRLYEQIRDGGAGVYLGLSSAFPGRSGVASQMPEGFVSSLAAAPSVAGEPPLFVGREKELEALSRALAGAAAGRGGVRLVTGEPGSGKTALLAEFARQALARHARLLVVWGECSAFTGQGDPYFPFVTIARTLGGEVEAPVSAAAVGPEHARRVWRSLPTTVGALLDHGPDLIDRFVSGRDLLARARLHGGVSPVELDRLQSLVDRVAQQPSQRRVRQAALFEQFTRMLSALAQRRPLVFIVDDMQWIDPGSVNLLFHLARRIVGRRILLLGAYRPRDAALHREAERHPLLDVVGELRRDFGDIHVDLMQSEGAAFVSALLDSEPNELDQSFRALLHRHTAGNPLFTIELLRAMQLRGEIRRSPEGRWVEGPRLNWEELPARVEAVIGRRIGHLSPVCQEVLGAASVEGERFTAEVVAGTLEEDVQYVCDLLSQEAGKEHRLVTAQTVRQVDGQRVSVYRFRHALFQIYLYQHLDVVERARLHGRVAQKLEQIYERTLDRFPEIVHSLARHFEVAGLTEKAVEYYARAGRHALRLSANREALAHFYNGLRLLETLPPTPERDRRELNLQLSLGPALTATKGWAPPEMAAAYARAQELIETIDDDARLIPALWLLATFRLGRSEHAEVDRLVERLSRLAQETNDPALLALVALQASPFYQGRFAEARSILERASAAPDVDLQRELAQRYGMAPAVVGLAYLAVCLWLLGFPAEADERMREARELAEQIGHPMAICYAVSRSCWLAAMKGELEDVRRYAATVDGVAQEFRLENFILAARFFTHWAAVQGGALDAERLDRMYQAIEAYGATGTVLNRTAFLALFAQACATAGEVARGLSAVDESLALGEETGELWFQAEAWGIKGELLRLRAAAEAEPGEALAAAERCFEEARRLAREQGAKAFELRLRSDNLPES